MSQPSRQECIAEGYELAQEILVKELGRQPTDEEIQEGYEYLCERYSDEIGECGESEMD